MARGRKAREFNLEVEGLQVKDNSFEFTVEVTNEQTGARENKTLSGTAPQVTFPDIAVATAFFGNVETLLKAAASEVNAAMLAQEKNSLRADALQFDRTVDSMMDTAIAQFIKVRGTEPTDEQRGKLRGKIVENLKSIANIDVE